MVANLERILDEVLKENAAFSLRDLAVSGKDLVSAGYAPGPEFRVALEAALEAVINEQIKNDAEEIWHFWDAEGFLAKLRKIDS